MTSSLRSVSIPRLLHVSGGGLERVAELVGQHGFDTRRVLVCCGRGPSRGFAATVVASLRQAAVEVEEQDGFTGELRQAADAAGRIIASQVTLAIAVGGGKVIDSVKLAAARTGTDFISIPTTLAHDGISSPVASLSVEGRRASYAAAMPAGIVVDTDVIAGAPGRTLRAGVGDLLSNLTAILDWQLAAAHGAEPFDAFSAMIAESAARPALDITDLDSQQSHEILAKGLLLSGLAMASAGNSRPCSGAEHLISHALDDQLGHRSAMHGEQVALGGLISAAAHHSPLLPQLRKVYDALGLPTAPEQVGLTNEDLVAAVQHAPGMRPDRYTVLDTVDLSQACAEELVRSALS